MMDRHTLLASAKAMAEAFNQEWIILQSCRDMIPLLENR